MESLADNIDATSIATTLMAIRQRGGLSQARLAQALGVSLVSVSKWERGASLPGPAQAQRIIELGRSMSDPWDAHHVNTTTTSPFASRGVRRPTPKTPAMTTSAVIPLLLFAENSEADDVPSTSTLLASAPLVPILKRLTTGRYFSPAGEDALVALLQTHTQPADTAVDTPPAGMSAGKNTYTYDAHTYHTKVPPQGIAELLKHYLPTGGLVLDPFAGSGMTGVASRALGYDCILNELSPAACFIAERFTSQVNPATFAQATQAILDETQAVRAELYTTACRECGKVTEILYTVWSYRVLCSECNHEFLLWDVCRAYGKRVRDHRILTEFPCPACQRLLKKSRLGRTIAEPVQIGYKCCGSRQQEVVHPLTQADLELVYRLQVAAPILEEFYPQLELPDGVNLRQPKHHGLRRISQFYTPRNLAAMSHLWQAIHRVEDMQLAAQLAFVFTSLYQRVTRLSEFRFWGGSGNTPRYNVPFIFNEANVFVTFARKARTIQDHLETTATHYQGRTLVIQNSATNLDYLPNNSVDLIFTDPPFGANINYSEMNLLWEAWLGRFTETRDEAIVNSTQGKTIEDYRRLMTQSLRECYRVLRPGHWLLLVFMNSSSAVWSALREALTDAGFAIQQADIFDKQHATFKQYVSENTAGSDLVLHCQKPLTPAVIAPIRSSSPDAEPLEKSVFSFLESAHVEKQRQVFLHVSRGDETDFRKLYSEWLAHSLLAGAKTLDFARFRALTQQWIEEQSRR